MAQKPLSPVFTLGSRHIGIYLGRDKQARSVLASPFPFQKLPWVQNEGGNLLRGEHFEAPQHLNGLASNFSANITVEGRSLTNPSRDLGNSPSVGPRLGRLNSSVQDGALLVTERFVSLLVALGLPWGSSSIWQQ